MKKRVCFLVILLLMLALCQCALAERVSLADRKVIREWHVKGLIQELSALPEGTEVDLTGVTIDLKDRMRLVEGLPTLSIVGDLSVSGKLVIPGDTEVLDLDSITREKFGNITLTRIFTCLPKLRHVTMFDQNVTVAQMEQIMAKFPGITFDWSVRIGNYRIRTDATAFSTLKGRQDPRYTAKQMLPLLYCTQLKAIDLGHNNVSDLSFLTNWPDLRILIVIDSKKPITDLSPLAELDHLEYVELFMQNITDLTPLANKPFLRDLNLCHNNITDLSPLYTDTALERLWISYNPGLTEEEVAAFKAAVPGCQVETVEYQSTGAGWREHWRYFIMYDIFQTRVWRPFINPDDPGASAE